MSLWVEQAQPEHIPRPSLGFMAVCWGILIVVAISWTALTLWWLDYVAANAAGWAATSAAVYGLCIWGAAIQRYQAAIVLEADDVAFGRGPGRKTIPWRLAEARWDGANFLIRSGSTRLTLNPNFYEQQPLFAFFQRRFPDIGRDRKRFHASVIAD